MSEFLIARNPEEATSLPYLLWIPLGDGVVVKARETWPRTAKVYCHRADGWPDDPEIVERVPVRSCVRRGASIDLVLDRGREARSQFVITLARGREMIFWQTARTAKQARPGVRTPAARAQGIADLTIIVDSHERYAWRFAEQQVTTVKRALPAGDYGVEREGQLVAVVERKSLDDLVSSLTSGKLRYQLADLAALPRAAVVVEDRYSRVLANAHVRPGAIADALAECQARFPSVPVFFAETRPLAEHWAYRFLAACLDADLDAFSSDEALAAVSVRSGPAAASPPSASSSATSRGSAGPAAIRAWARAQGIAVSERGRIAADVRAAYEQAQADNGEPVSEAVSGEVE